MATVQLRLQSTLTYCRVPCHSLSSSSARRRTRRLTTNAEPQRSEEPKGTSSSSSVSSSTSSSIASSASASRAPEDSRAISKPSLTSPYPRKPTASEFNSKSHSFETVIPRLPSKFGSNQTLRVPDETRALLEEIVGSFRAPIRYAFAYGSGVFKQKGYATNFGATPMLDFVFAVSHADHWHALNLEQNPSHYPLAARLVGSSSIARFQKISPGLWFNPYVSSHGATIKYGVTSIDTLSTDLLSWNTLYLSGRMHKPIRIIKDDPRIRLTQQVNLASALRTALLTLPSTVTATHLFEAITSLSYAGDPRMSGWIPGENRSKVKNIVDAQSEQFRELYWKLASGMSGVQWEIGKNVIEQDTEPRARLLHLRKLPHTLLRSIETQYLSQSPDLASMKEGDEAAFWLKVAGDESLADVIRKELAQIVRGPATVQSLKGIATAGVVKSALYSTDKIGKWWRG